MSLFYGGLALILVCTLISAFYKPDDFRDDFECGTMCGVICGGVVVGVIQMFVGFCIA